MMDDSRFKGQPEAPRSAGSYQLDMDLVPRNVWRSCTLFFPWSGQKTTSYGVTHATKRANHSESCSETIR